MSGFVPLNYSWLFEIRTWLIAKHEHIRFHKSCSSIPVGVGDQTLAFQ